MRGCALLCACRTGKAGMVARKPLQGCRAGVGGNSLSVNLSLFLQDRACLICGHISCRERGFTILLGYGACLWAGRKVSAFVSVTRDYYKWGILYTCPFLAQATVETSSSKSFLPFSKLYAPPVHHYPMLTQEQSYNYSTPLHEKTFAYHNQLKKKTANTTVTAAQ